MSDPYDFKEGDRVRVRANCTDRFLQPWRDRFASGRQGTVKGTVPAYRDRSGYRVRVYWDHRRAKEPVDWLLDMDPRELELVQEPSE